jgi:AcrR family transcriptional regulator
LDAISIQQIAAAASASLGLLMYHFGSKGGLRQVVYKHVARCSVEQTAPARLYERVRPDNRLDGGFAARQA